MGYVGNTPAERYARMDKQTITGDGTTGPYTLDHSVGSEQEIEVFVNNVRQEPGSGKAYTVSGNQLTMGGNVDSTDDFYLIYQGKTIGTVTHPPTHSLEAADGTFTGGVLIKGAAPSTSNSGKLSYNTTSGVMEFSAHSTGGDTKINFVTSDSGSQSTNLHIAHDGGVGVGTTSPFNAKLHVYNTGVNYARIGTTTKGHYFESQSDSATDGFEIYQQHGSNTSRNSFVVNDNRTGSKSAAFAIRGDGAISTPSQPIGWRRNTNTANGWVTMTTSAHYEWTSWETTGNSWYGDSKADTIADNGRFTATHAGWYLVGHEGYVSTATSAQTAKYTYAYVYKNGSAHYSDGRIMGYGGDFNDKFYQNTNPVYLEAGDYITCGLYNVGNGAQYYSPYCGYWVYYLG